MGKAHHDKSEAVGQSAATDQKETGRLESFSDGVFSVAITLLVLELKVPPVDLNSSARALGHALALQWPSYFAFVTSFFSVLIMWMNHHGVFRLIKRGSPLLLACNGLLLMLVTAVPFSTALVAAYLRTPAASTACMVYAGLFVLINFSYNLLMWAAARCELATATAGAKLIHRRKGTYYIGFPLYLIAMVAAPLNIWITLGICTALWVYWAIATTE